MTTLKHHTFMELVDEVLSGLGRPPLPEDGSERAIITVGPNDRVLQIIAGPGSGKTEMLIWRILYDLFVLGTPSQRLLVTTFTRRAATELSLRLVERSDALIDAAHARDLSPADPKIHDVRIGTIHALCDGLLAEFDVEYMAASTEVIDDFETRVRLARQINFNQFRDLVRRLEQVPSLIALFEPPWADGRWPSTTTERVEWCMDVLAQQTETWIPRCSETGEPNGIETVERRQGLTTDLATLQTRWEAYLDSQAVLDFPTIQKRFHERQAAVLPHIDHVFVDEFQDTNPIQFAIHMGWLQGNARLTVVGDDDQSIYRFRGSDIDCFTGLEPACSSIPVAFRTERLEENRRSTKSIVAFTEAFRRTSILAQGTLQKTLRPSANAEDGPPVRLLSGPWAEICRFVAEEIAAFNGEEQDRAVPDAAVLLFSTSERTSRRGPTATAQLRGAIEGAGLRMYNPRSKTAAEAGSPLHDLLGLVSYLIDPVTKAPAGSGGRTVQVFASSRETNKVAHAISAPPGFSFMAEAHSQIQRRMIRVSGGDIGRPGPTLQPMIAYLDELRTLLITAAAHGTDEHNRLTLAGVIHRLLSFPRFRGSGFTMDLYRQALFTTLLEANIAPTRLTRQSLDMPLSAHRNVAGKIVWPDQYWSLLNTFGPLIDGSRLDDVEVEAFAERAVPVLTFHQAKGLEFDHVYVGLTGRQAQPNAVLRTMLFSGAAHEYRLEADGFHTPDNVIQEFAEKDRDREVYVAMTRPRKRLTILQSPEDERFLMALNPVLAQLFEGLPVQQVAGYENLNQRLFA